MTAERGVADPFDLAGRVVIVTGASSGMGRHFAELLHERGAVVVAAARRADRLAELAAGHPGLVAVTCDVTDADDRARLVSTAIELTGTIDVLVNNAGAGAGSPSVDVTVEAFEGALALNLTAVFALSTAVGRHMIAAGRGSIVSIASVLGLVASHPLQQAAYNAAKAGVVNLTRQLGSEWAADGVRCNAIAPGWFPTEITDDMFATERSMRWIERNTPMRRPGRLHELDGALLLLASDAGSFITGQTIVVDGGWTAV